jgi:hypothetical protein
LIETETTERIGADRYQRSDSRVTERNGSRPRLLATQAGEAVAGALNVLVVACLSLTAAALALGWAPRAVTLILSPRPVNGLVNGIWTLPGRPGCPGGTNGW